MKKIIKLIFVLSVINIYSQQINVKYINVRSPVVTIYENLYIDKDKINVISIVDSLSKNTNLNPRGLKYTSPKLHFISKIKKNERDFYFNDLIKSEIYFIADVRIKNPDWKIDKTKSKKMLGYDTFKAETVFRGSKIIAYYTEQLPYSTGPFKFFGLPGLILDVRVENKDFDLWKAVSIDLDNKTIIDFMPKLNHQPKLEIKEFIRLKDESMGNFNSEIQKLAPLNSRVEFESKTNRYGVEQKFEWE